MEVDLAASETGAETSGDPLGIVAGGDQVIALTDAVFADASTDRLQRLRAWEHRLDALLAQHQWASAAAPDGGADPALLDQLRQAAASATAELDAAAVAPGAEANAAAAIATATARIATITGDDPAPAERRAAAFAAQGVAGESETAGPQPVCREARHYQTGIARAATGDFDGARVAFEGALAVNPEHLPSAIELSWTLARLGDSAAAIARIEAALDLAPNDARSWELLSLYWLDSGEIGGATEALDRFAQLLGGEVSQRRLALLTTMIEEWQRLVDADQGRAADVRAMLPPATRTVATLPAEDVRSPQAALVMAALGGLALDVDDPATAEPLLRRGLDLDPRLPVARAHLALAVAAGDGDSTVEIEAATAELTDPLWGEIGESPETIAEEMRRAVTAYIDGNAGREEHAQPLLDALDDA
jgi:tetratricopeptide (TPR) repeat protein